jgi:mono/diheme cytochrome c family protein
MEGEESMKRMMTVLTTGGLLLAGSTVLALAGGGHGTGTPEPAEQGHTEATGMMPGSLDEAREMHKAHEHGHDFEAMEEMSADQMARVMALMNDIGVATPPMDAQRGREVFVQKGCVACHSVNGVGGDLGPALNAADMPSPMNTFEFAARMWRGAQAMTALQEDMMGEVISLDGQDLADLVAFAHDENEQALLTKDQIPERFHGLIEGE